MEIGTDPRQVEFEAQVEALRRRYLDGLPARRAALAEAWCRCVDSGDDAPWQQLDETAHKLSGSAPCYGFEALGQAARDLDMLVSKRVRPCRERAQAQASVERLLTALDAVIASGV